MASLNMSSQTQYDLGASRQESASSANHRHSEAQQHDPGTWLITNSWRQSPVLPHVWVWWLKLWRVEDDRAPGQVVFEEVLLYNASENELGRLRISSYLEQCSRRQLSTEEARALIAPDLKLRERAVSGNLS
jgi:hypothetical protein